MHSPGITQSRRWLVSAFSALLAGAALSPAVALADTAAEITAEIVNASADVRKNLKDADNSISSKGSLQFWSSGGLVQSVGNDTPGSSYDSFSLTPKHIQIVVLEEGRSAVAMYYSEGSFQETGGTPVAHYMTRVTEAYVKEDGEWKVRAAHYSPIAAGSGTPDTAVD